MDDRRFDAFTKRLAAATTARRSLLAGLGGVALGFFLPGARAGAATTPAPLPPFPKTCASATAKLPDLEIVALPANRVAGSCKDFLARLTTRGAIATAKPTTANPNRPTFLNFTVTLAPLGEPAARQEGGQWCATLTVQYPQSLTVSVTPALYALEWEPKLPKGQCSPSACLAAFGKLIADALLVEHRHAADLAVVQAQLRERWSAPRAYQACAASAADAKSQALALFNADWAGELQRLVDHYYGDCGGGQGATLGKDLHFDCAGCAPTPACGAVCCGAGQTCVGSGASRHCAGGYRGVQVRFTGPKGQYLEIDAALCNQAIRSWSGTLHLVSPGNDLTYPIAWTFAPGGDTATATVDHVEEVVDGETVTAALHFTIIAQTGSSGAVAALTFHGSEDVVDVGSFSFDQNFSNFGVPIPLSDTAGSCAPAKPAA